MTEKTASTNELDLALRRLLDENAILTLMARFDDAVIRQDTDAFRTLWVPDAVWEIGEPIPMQAKGVDEIVAALQKFNDVNEFFFRTTLRPVIMLDGDRAISRSPSTEYARRRDGHGYNNVAIWQDKLERRDGNWLFVSRQYYYVWVDNSSAIPGTAVALPTSVLSPE